MKKVKGLFVDLKVLIGDDEISFTTNQKGLDFLMGIFGNLEIPFLFKNAEYKNEDAWIDGNKVFETIKKFKFDE